ncbi:MAG TPA: DUF1573 domain-containing protein [Flavobacteriales bacterium]|jgi:hypothetical protein|nr:DUF1573 domain-containing protein [Flavobacteriales bacterium]|tara:strand:- start:4632 stop:5141 length:510 start_codon:yes stop_codon:yes gene_type:complete
MKKIILLLTAFLIGFVVLAQRIPQPEKAEPVVEIEEAKQEQIEEPSSNATIDFESKVYDYGVLEHNGNGDGEFIFTNNGTEALLIKNAKGSCGCTVPTWPREPIMPGETSKIGVKYATNRVGKFTKTITLTTNASKKPAILTIKGEVTPPPKEAQAPEKKNEGAPLENK